MGLASFNKMRREQEAKLKLKNTSEQAEESIPLAEENESATNIAEETPTQGEPLPVAFEDITKNQLKDILEKNGIEYANSANKEVLFELAKPFL